MEDVRGGGFMWNSLNKNLYRKGILYDIIMILRLRSISTILNLLG